MSDTVKYGVVGKHQHQRKRRRRRTSDDDGLKKLGLTPASSMPGQLYLPTAFLEKQEKEGKVQRVGKRRRNAGR